MGRPQPESLVEQEYASRFEVRLYDGHSTGLFLDLREHRRALSERRPARVLNLFAYTCAFAVPLTAAGAHVTNVDVSARYLEWGKRNLALNGFAPSVGRFFRMDAFEYLAYAARHREERFDPVIIDPPTFAAGERRRGVKPWKAVDDYPALVQAAMQVLAPGGSVFAASNTRELAATGALAQLVTSALGSAPAWQPLPPWPVDVTETGRVAAVLFTRDARSVASGSFGWTVSEGPNPFTLAAGRRELGGQRTHAGVHRLRQRRRPRRAVDIGRRDPHAPLVRLNVRAPRITCSRYIACAGGPP